MHHDVLGADEGNPHLAESMNLCIDTQPRPIRDRPEIDEGATIKFLSVHYIDIKLNLNKRY